MKKVIVILSVLLMGFNCVYAQDSILLNGKYYKMELVDSSKFSIEGWWKLVDIQYILDRGMPDLERKWDKQELGDMANFSDKVLALYSANLMGVGLIDPLYELSYDDTVHSVCVFNQRFLNKLLAVSVFLKNVEGPYFINYILNPNLMVVYWGNEAIYYERILDKRKINYNGWSKDKDWNIVSYKGSIVSFDTFIDSIVVNNPAYELEYIFTPQPSCPLDTSFYKSYFMLFSYKELKKKSYNIVDSTQLKNHLPIKGKITGEKLKSNLISFMLPSCPIEEAWTMRWRVKRKEGK